MGGPRLVTPTPIRRTGLPLGQFSLNRAAAVSNISWSRLVAEAKVVWRVIVVKSDQRSLIWMVLPAREALRRRRPTCSERSRKALTSCCSPVRSLANVTSLLTDFTSCSVEIGRLSIPCARRRRSGPYWPNIISRVPGEIFARAPMVLIPKVSNLMAVLGPTPHSDCTGRGAKNAASSPGGMMVMVLDMRKEKFLVSLRERRK